MGGIGLMRSRQETAFGEREVHLARLAAPTLALAVEQRRLLARLGRDGWKEVRRRLARLYALSPL